ncbi:hypothetical protein F2P81_008005 [Scophthalmus maximus]|uniref:Carboxymuconolactone decarboxylase-like domain-containing protein n=1 Tax=Scophthalmus maximus TaxID=52904 RepID=A0A6A4T710_SCOMX|nr:hypothetical protein F2P81_008005 [Scophthalmus maximus]
MKAPPDNIRTESVITDMATQVISKLFRPAVFTQLAALRLRGKVAAAAAAGTRQKTSDPPPEKVSRYPVPYRTDLPVDIVELMEEVETKVVVNYENAELGPRERAMLDFAMAVCRCDTITEQHFQALEEVGFDREDAWDIAAIAAFFAMSNRLAHLTDMRPNLEFYNMGRLPRDKSKDK